MRGKHTPGPWKVNPEGDREVMSVTSRRLIADCRTAGNVAPHDRANARLIARSPELLAIVRAFAYYFTPELTRDVVKHESQVKALDAAHAMLAEIDGGAP